MNLNISVTRSGITLSSLVPQFSETFPPSVRFEHGNTSSAGAAPRLGVIIVIEGDAQAVRIPLMKNYGYGFAYLKRRDLDELLHGVEGVVGGSVEDSH